ncbi:MAG: hypothetical protein SFV18_20650 [Bryobacteraceae bacterium]|nr:hypothetical protein [Bryobacteraceae bacterium]
MNTLAESASQIRRLLERKPLSGVERAVRELELLAGELLERPTPEGLPLLRDELRALGPVLAQGAALVGLESATPVSGMHLDVRG